MLDPFARSSAVNPAALANVLTNEFIHGRSSIDMVDGKFTGSFLEMPGGPIDFAVGASWRREKISGTVNATNYVHVDGTTNTAIQNLTAGGLQVDPFSGSRNITAQFAEVRIPLTSDKNNISGFYNFDVVAAVRHEHYSGVGDSTVPKVGFRWQPVPRQITIRGNFAKSFTAPSLYALAGPLNFRTSQGPIGNSGIAGALNYTFNAEDGNNPNVKPAKSNSYSLGIVLKPDFAPGLRIDAEFNSVSVKGLPGGIGFNNILSDVNLNGSNSIFFNNIALGGFPGLGGSNAAFAAPGAVASYVTNIANATSANTFGNLYLVDRFTNLGSTRIKSLNFTTTYDADLGNSGKLSFLNQAAVLLSYKFQALPVTGATVAPTQVAYEFAGFTTQGGGAQGTLPKLRMYTALDWSMGQWSFGVANTFIGAVSDIGAGGSGFYVPFNAANPQFVVGHVNSYTSWDLRASWSSNRDEPGGHGLKVTAGVNNLFNRMPPVSSNINPAAGVNSGAVAWRAENNADVSTYGAIGRLFYVAAGFRF